jgi:deazaflavin-dependent oxidoreductase (nitroreductase family)
MTEFDRAAFETALIADIRANGGAVTQGPMAGRTLLILTTTGARSGESRRAILAYMRDGDDYVVAGSNSGQPADPAWVRNIVADASVTIEAGGHVFGATARVADDADRAILWDRLVAAMPAFGEYPRTSGRTIPMIRLTPSAG